MTGLVRKILGLLRWRDGSQLEVLAQKLKVGGLYSIIHDGDAGTFRIVKILVLEPSVVHLCIYATTFPARPENVDLSTLSLGGISTDDLDDDMEDLDMSGFGIGHLPLSLKDFVYGWQPMFLASSSVTDDDLEGYKMWKEGNGGVFGNF